MRRNPQSMTQQQLESIPGGGFVPQSTQSTLLSQLIQGLEGSKASSREKRAKAIKDRINQSMFVNVDDLLYGDRHDNGMTKSSERTVVQTFGFFVVFVRKNE